MTLNKRNEVIVKPGIEDLLIDPGIFQACINDWKVSLIGLLEAARTGSFSNEEKRKFDAPCDICTGIKGHTIFDFLSARFSNRQAKVFCGSKRN